MKDTQSVLLLSILCLALISCKPGKTYEHVGDEAYESSAVISVVASDDIVGNFGEAINLEGAISPNQVLSLLGDQEKVTMKVEGTIVEVCQMKGCWMTMDLGNGETMRITFKDYGFFVPKKASGYLAVMEGVVSREIIEVEELRHFAEDAGKSQEEIDAITEPGESLNFEAVGVVITGLGD